jgi:hypothetical protein
LKDFCDTYHEDPNAAYTTVIQKLLENYDETLQQFVNDNFKDSPKNKIEILRLIDMYQSFEMNPELIAQVPRNISRELDLSSSLTGQLEKAFQAVATARAKAEAGAAAAGPSAEAEAAARTAVARRPSAVAAAAAAAKDAAAAAAAAAPAPAQQAARRDSSG